MNNDIFLKKTLLIFLLCISIIIVFFKTSFKFNEISIIKSLQKEKKKFNKKIIKFLKSKRNML